MITVQYYDSEPHDDARDLRNWRFEVLDTGYVVQDVIVEIVEKTFLDAKIRLEKLGFRVIA
jgi:hypothetical protein